MCVRFCDGDPMNPLHYEAIRRLGRCTFRVASWDKRFVGDMARLGEYDLLSPKQEANVERLAYRYRNQLAQQGYNVPDEFLQALAERRLADEGKNTADIKYHWVPDQKPALEPEKPNPQLPLLELP